MFWSCMLYLFNYSYSASAGFYGSLYGFHVLCPRSGERASEQASARAREGERERESDTEREREQGGI